MKNYDRDAFLRHLRNMDWDLASPTTWDDPNFKANKFFDLFNSILDVHAPLIIRKSIARHAPSPWITPRIKDLIRERDHAKRKAEKDHSIWPKYKRLRNKVTGELRMAVENYYRNSIDENANNPKMMWKTINKVLNKDQNSTTPRAVMYEGQLVEKQDKIAEAFNNHFTSVGPKLAEKIETKVSDDPLKYMDKPTTVPDFEFQSVTADTIKNEINKM
eukprot:gene4431-5023_t